jgi:iron(III) transport system substrate-binding protein
VLSRRLRSLPAAFWAASLAWAPTPAPAQGSLTLYCSVLAEWCEVMRQEFERASAVRVLMTVKSAGETLAQLRAEAANPRADAWWGGGGDQHLQAAELGLTEVYKSPTLAKLHPWARRQAEQSGWRTVGIYAGTLGIVWNTEQLASRRLPAPRCWSDLIKPEYRGELQMANAATSGTSYTFIATLVQILGEEPAFDYLKKLHRNMNQYPRSGAAPMRNTASGETTLAVTWMFAAVAEAEAGFPVTSVAPCEGTGYEIGSMSIVKGARNPGNARAWYEFALTPAAQATGVRAKSYQIPSHMEAPLPPKTPRLADVKLIDYDFAKFGSNEVRTRLVQRWEKEVAGLPR